MNDNSSQYKSSTEMERFERQVERDLNRTSAKRQLQRGENPRLSQSVLRRLIQNDTSQWARDVLNQKLSNNVAGNIATRENRAKTSKTIQTEQQSQQGFEPSTVYTSAFGFGATEEPTTPPDGGTLPSFKTYICVDGEPKLYEIYGRLA